MIFLKQSFVFQLLLFPIPARDETTSTFKRNQQMVVKLILKNELRIHLADTVKLRAPVSESLTRLQRDDLQKFAQVQ